MAGTQAIAARSPLPIKYPTYTPTPTLKAKAAYVDPDPIINCGPGVKSGQVVKVKSSECKNYIDCGLDNNTQYFLITKAQCDDFQTKEANIKNNVEEYRRYTQQLVQNLRAQLPKFSIAPFPTIEPYQPSQEYTDSYNRNMENLTQPWAPTQSDLSNKKCYATWDEYFAAHPTNGTAVSGTSGTPPCD